MKHRRRFIHRRGELERLTRLSHAGPVQLRFGSERRLIVSFVWLRRKYGAEWTRLLLDALAKQEASTRPRMVLEGQLDAGPTEPTDGGEGQGG